LDGAPNRRALCIELLLQLVQCLDAPALARTGDRPRMARSMLIELAASLSQPTPPPLTGSDDLLFAELELKTLPVV
jgi:hypothetical protein